MPMLKKLIFLFLALLLPIVVFLFLKAFGKNEFTIPVYFEKEMAEHPTACQFNYVTPYSVPDSVMKAIGWKGESVVLIIADHSPEVNRNLKHLAQEFKPEDFQLISSSNTSEWDNWHSCFFFLKKPWSAVLVDTDRKIRGYYEPGSREEMDRLIVEMKILLKQY